MPTGSRKKRPIASTIEKATVPTQVPPPISCFSPFSSSSICALAEIPRALKPILSDSPSAATPRISGRRSQRWRFTIETSGSETTSISPSAASVGSRWCPSASCSGEGLRTATAHVETPRIITPSSTAWPPIGASIRFGSSLCGSRSLIPSPYRRQRAPQEPSATDDGTGGAQHVVVLVRLAKGVRGVGQGPHGALAHGPVEAHRHGLAGLHEVDGRGVRPGAVDEEVDRHEASLALAAVLHVDAVELGAARLTRAGG